MDVIEWPANSLDLNPVENIWGRMKLELSYLVIRDFEEFQQKVAQLWDTISYDYLTSLVSSMHNRLQECIAARGGIPVTEFYIG